MVITFLIAAGIAVYTILVLRNKIADIKKGRFCNCDCGLCSVDNCNKKG